MTDNIPTRDKVDRLAQSCDLAKAALASNDSFSIGQSILHECSSTLRALSARLAEMEARCDQWEEKHIDMMRQRNEARAEIERLRAALEAIYQMTASLTDPEHICGRVEVEARARAALAEKGKGE